MTLPPRTGLGRGRTKLLKAAFAFLHACRFEAVQEREQLLLEPQQLRACLAEAPIGVGQFADLAEFLRGRGDVLRPALASIGEDGAGVQFSLGTVASGFSTAAAKGVERAGQERFAGEERFEESLDLWGHGENLGAERAEVASHGWVSRIAEVIL
jgi:hypothetical protein